MIFSRIKLKPLVLLTLSAAATPAFSGAYLFAGESNGVNIVTHPNTYFGTGGVVTVRVCIDPASPNATDMVQPVINNIAEYNAFTPSLGNVQQGSNNNIPSGSLDFESVSLHEIGHCLGMAHVNAASESGLTGANQNYTKATDGVNNTFDLDAGVDGVIGSSDDVRGDDQNLYWFRQSNNDPFTIETVVDSTTYSRDVADLPAGHNFPANPDRDVSTLLGYTKTEAVMQQGSYYDEAQRTLGHDDIATLRYAASGLDERESGGPAGSYANDNYSIVLEYGGISTTNCDVTMAITTTSSLAFCSVGGSYIGSDHLRITTASIEFGDSYNWFFNSDNTAPVLSSIGDKFLTEGDSLVLVLSATDADGDALSFAATNLPAYGSLVDHGDGTATLTLSPQIGDFGLDNMMITVSDDGVPVLTDEETFAIDITALDTDGDGISDYDEINVYGTLPGNADSDGDLIDDGVEINNGSDPLSNMSWPNFADGDVAPLGAPDGLINAADYAVMQRLVLGDITAAPLQYAHGDLYPVSAPDGVLDTADLILLLQVVQP